MLKRIVLFMILAMSFFLDAGEFPPARKAVECSPRDGLPNFFSKIDKGSEIKVAFLGGSVSEQPGWRVKVLEYLRRTYSTCRFIEINAAIGGTPSSLGVLRMDRDTLDRNPDLIFVDFAVNDARVKPEETLKSMEGIIRKTWSRFPECDICFVYIFAEWLMTDLKAGNLNPSASVMELVADKYGIPSVHMGIQALRLLKDGKLVMSVPPPESERGKPIGNVPLSARASVQGTEATAGIDGKIIFSPDGTHPYLDTGHQLYEEALERSLPLIKTLSKKSGSHILPEPLASGNYGNTVMIELDNADLSGPWSKMDKEDVFVKKFGQKTGTLWKGCPGAVLGFRFKGANVWIYSLTGSDCGKLEISVDGKLSSAITFDKFMPSWRRPVPLPIALTLNPDEIHEVVLKVSGEKLDKEKLLCDAESDQKKINDVITEFRKNAAYYEGSNFYCSAIFIDGIIVRKQD